MTKQYHDLIQYAFEQTLLMMYRHLFQFPNTGVIRKLTPSQPLRAKEVGVFCSETIKTFDINLGQGSISVGSKENAHWSRKLSVRNTTNDVKKESVSLESKDKGGSLSHRQSISQKKEAHWAKTYKGGLRKLGHPADSDPENGDSQAKVRDNKSKSK